jgi:hypothetical protein
MRVLRGGPGNFQSEVALHNQTVVVTYGDPYARGTHQSVYALRIFACRIIHRPRHLAGSAVSECVLFDQYYILTILNIIKIFNPNLSD